MGQKEDILGLLNLNKLMTQGGKIYIGKNDDGTVIVHQQQQFASFRVDG